ADRRGGPDRNPPCASGVRNHSPSTTSKPRRGASARVSGPTSCRDQTTVQTNSAPYSQLPQRLPRQSSAAEEIRASPAAADHADPPTLRSLTPPASKTAPVRARLSA